MILWKARTDRSLRWSVQLGGGTQSSNQSQQLLEGMMEILNQPEIVKKVSLNSKGYFPLKDVKRHELFVLIDLDNLDKPFLFHYDWSLRKAKNPKDRLKQVTSINYESFRSAKMKLKGSSDKSLYLPPLWMKDWKGTQLRLDQDCKFHQNNESSYKLMCNNSIKTTRDNSLIQEISTKDITFPSKR
ncbi:hypothetical protein OVS_01085 [Mycoplasma ovis str. Michigan]|uniref:Uncharacterized protein n=1 Tax=Mycoplasma ovis str. Michigan TaxID=1415773 RepID=A0ABM5P134_9MOLU|nr:hypothetical protein [Mycoplasma ovis]AHC40178.1 hypothetical protein OVS_01085 [Mycoplasma ovis str. Michigan]